MTDRHQKIRDPAEDEGRAITAAEVTLFGVECYLPADIAQEVEQACAAHELAEVNAAMGGQPEAQVVPGATIPADSVDGELSVEQAINDLCEMHPGADRLAMKLLAALFTHKTVVRYRASLAPHQPEARVGGEVSYAECCDTPAYCSSVRRCTAKDTPPPSAVPEWRPIESAPRDGTSVLWGAAGKVPQQGHWANGPVFSSEWDEDVGYLHPSYAPTHWMPLPAAPEPGEGE